MYRERERNVAEIEFGTIGVSIRQVRSKSDGHGMIAIRKRQVLSGWRYHR